MNTPLANRQQRPAVSERSLLQRPWVIITLAVVFALFLGSLVLTIIAAVDSSSRDGGYWSTFTGPVGDTFGGLLGPILNAAVLAATIYIAVQWEPGRERERRQREAASKVVAWVADTEDYDRQGIVISNTSPSVAQTVDLVVTNGDAKKRWVDREAVIPPGVWFIEFTPPADEGTDAEWALPVNVDLSTGMVMWVEDADGEPERVFLVPHLPQKVDGVVRPHYQLQELRYTLDGGQWIRCDGGDARRAESDAPDESLRKQRLLTPRVSARTGGSRKLAPDVMDLLRHTIETVAPGSVASGVEILDAARNPLTVDQSVLPGVASVSRSTRGGTLTFLLTTDNRKVVMHQRGVMYPGSVYVYDAAGNVVHDDKGKKLSSRGQKAAAEAVMGKGSPAFSLTRDASDWLLDEAQKKSWLIALKVIVRVASGKSPDEEKG